MKKALAIKKVRVPQEKMFCNYIHRICNQTRLDGYDFCIRHILEDKSSPFRQCSYVHIQNRKRCTNAAPKNEKRDSLCPWHSKRALLGSKITPTKKKVVEGPAAVLLALEHYCQDANHNPAYDRSAAQKEKRDSMPVDGGCPADLKVLGSKYDSNQSTCLEQTWIGSVDDSESADSEQEDCLKHAGVYTAEEVAKITKDKLFRLQALYIDQLKRLQHVLCEKRRNYLHELKIEQETHGNIMLSKAAIEDKTCFEKLKALKRYHRRSGIDLLLHHKYLEKRKVMPAGDKLDTPKHTLCTFSEKGRKCYQKAIVLTKFCFKHILSDPNQVLYKPCGGDGKADCKRPVLPYKENVSCMLHTQIVEIKPKLERIEDRKELTSTESDTILEPEHFQSMDDIASLGLDVVTPGSLFGLDQFGEPGESTDTVLSEDQADLMQIQPITLNPPDNILCDSRKSESDGDK